MIFKEKKCWIGPIFREKTIKGPKKRNILEAKKYEFWRTAPEYSIFLVLAKKNRF